MSTVHGFIPDDPKEIQKYKNQYASEWEDILGKGKYEIKVDESEWTETENKMIDFDDED